MAEARLPGSAKVAAGVSAVLAVTAALIEDGMVGWVVGITVFVLLTYAIIVSPIRYSLMGLMACALMLECPNDMPAGGAWKSYLYPVGAAMLAHLNLMTGVSWMSLSGADVLLLEVVIVAVVRRLTNSPIDRRGRIPGPEPMRRLAYLSLVGTALVWLWGIARGGDFAKSLWQVEKVIYLPVVFLMFDEGLRKPKDFVPIGRILIVAACFKSLVAIFVMNFVTFAGEPPSYATSHHDSLLFASAVVLLVSLVIHRARKHALRTALLVFPLILSGMILNNRRMVWVQVGLVFLTLYFAMPMNPVKKKIRRWAFRLSPVLLVYAAIGWYSPSGIFKPMATLKSVTQPATDVSTMTRDIENYDITMTIRAHPIAGTGYGHGYFELIPLPPMPHPLERYLPHNSLLGLWFASGLIGYTAMTLLWAGGVYFGVRAYRFSTNRLDRATSLLSFGVVQMYLIQCYGDVGLGSWTAVYTVAPGLAIGGKVAVMSGAWPVANARKTRTARSESSAANEPRAQAPHPGHAGSGS